MNYKSTSFAKCEEINNNNIALLTSLNDTKNELANIKNILKDTEDNLSIKTNDLQVAYGNIDKLNNTLQNTNIELNNHFVKFVSVNNFL